MKAKKSLGQNFLKSIPALNQIIKAGEISAEDIILEIGPGKGALTEKLLEKAKTVIAVEKDHELFVLLKEKFSKQITMGSLVLVHDDILDFDVDEAVSIFTNGLAGIGTRGSEDLSKNLKLRNYKIIANIPYNITGAILKKFLTAKHQPEQIVLMIQQEVAKRIVARDEKESILSISVKAYGEPKMIMKVPARYFSPAPKVDSAVICIKNISRKIFAPTKIGVPAGVGEEKFWEIVKAGFAHKRKKLSGNLKNIISSEKLKNLGFADKRAEDLSLKDWILLAKS
jgi:16S rRNA (adenine1518-N6/adenine1519-N6)-dimethyltransferase